MYKPGDNPWLYDEMFDPMVDFCFWVLELDGLHVPPFEHHSGGDGALRAAGMTAQSWETWAQEVIRTHERRLHTYQQKHIEASQRWLAEQQEKNEKSPKPSREERLNFLRQTSLTLLATEFMHFPSFPPDFWKGEPAAGTRLADLWEHHYFASANQRNIPAMKAEEKRGEWLQTAHDPNIRVRKHHKGDTPANLYQDLWPYHDRLQFLSVRFVAYPQPIEYLVPPYTIVVTTSYELHTYENLRERVWHAAERLASLQTNED
jgi:hypothetical protein